ncbi:hypothetical protein F5Y19DRAFT_470094 [Xylariaceae sp. FL1651]|nr:hypothetical protein F5Y19DRAFT_470094 [Xylariaceae sp. FL1651]
MSSEKIQAQSILLPHEWQRAHLVRSEDSDDDGSSLSHESKRASINSTTSKFACHFAKLDSAVALGHCKTSCDTGWIDIHRLKYELRLILVFRLRRMCFISFNTEEGLKDHTRIPESCEVLSTPKHEQPVLGIDESKERSLRRRKRGLSEYAKWYDIWDILFPTFPHPKTPYCSEEGPLRQPDAQRAVGQILLELRANLLEATRSVSQHRTSELNTGCDPPNYLEDAIQKCVNDSLKKWAPTLDITPLPPETFPPIDVESTKIWSIASQPLAVSSIPSSPSMANIQAKEIYRSKELPSRIDRGLWEKYKPSLEYLYLKRNLSLPVVMQEMLEKHKFSATAKQYRYQLGEAWGWKKYQQSTRISRHKRGRAKPEKTGALEMAQKALEDFVLVDVPQPKRDGEPMQGVDTGFVSLNELPSNQAVESQGIHPWYSPSLSNTTTSFFPDIGDLHLSGLFSEPYMPIEKTGVTQETDTAESFGFHYDIQ